MVARKARTAGQVQVTAYADDVNAPRVSGPEYPGQRPIAVVDKYGMITPMPGNVLIDAYLPEENITYIYNMQDLHKIKEYNDRAIESRRFEMAVAGLDFFNPSTQPNGGYDQDVIHGANFGGTKLPDPISIDLRA